MTVPRPTCLVCGTEGELAYRNCYDFYCGSPGSYDYLCCRTCGLLWISPQPSLDELIRLYNDYHGETLLTPTFHNSPGSAKTFIRRCVLASMGYPGTPWMRLLGTLLGRLPVIGSRARYGLGWTFLPYRPSGRLLEIGCGTGWYLKIMRDWGWDVIGIEPDSSAVAKGRTLYGVEVIEGTLEQKPFPEAHFDAIVMRHVIEHLPEPETTLQECLRILKPGGMLALATPNGQSLASRWFGRYWRGATAPWHLYLFSPRSLRRLLAKCGFASIRIRTTAVSAHWVYTASRYIREGRYDARKVVPSHR